MTLRRILLSLLGAALSLPVGAAKWTATFDHVGPLRLGMSLAAVNRVLGDHLSTPSIPAQDPGNSCFVVQPARFPLLYLMVIDGRLERIDVTARGVPTAKGVQVGDTEKAVLAAYGTGTHIAPAAYYVEDPNYKSITVLSAGGRHGARFLSDHGKIKWYRIGTAKAIQYDEGRA